MSKTKRWNIPVPDHLDKQLEDYIEKDAYKTKSEFVRTAVRDRLKEENKRLKEEKEAEMETKKQDGAENAG